MILTEEERKQHVEAFDEFIEAMGKGDEAGIIAAQQKIKPPAEVLMAYKKTNGADWIRKNGYNTIRADEAYGKDWLDR